MREGYCSRPVCVSVCLSVTALVATVSVYTCNQRHPRASLRLYLILNVWNIENNLPFKSYGVKSQYANELELTASRYRALSEPAKCRNCLKDDW